MHAHCQTLSTAYKLLHNSEERIREAIEYLALFCDVQAFVCNHVFVYVLH